jgi:two-component system cell cycle sensor histidine kinase/response regulator CckA
MQALGQLAGGIAHDFNNLLTAMIGFCDLLLLRSRPGDPAFPDIMQIKQNANRAANLVRQLLAFSRQQNLQPRVLDITDVLTELSDLLRRLIGENIELEFDHGRDLGLVKADQGQLEQVIINLAVNARDAMPEGGKLITVPRIRCRSVPSSREQRPCPRAVTFWSKSPTPGSASPLINWREFSSRFFQQKRLVVVLGSVFRRSMASSNKPVDLFLSTAPRARVHVSPSTCRAAPASTRLASRQPTPLSRET